MTIVRFFAAIKSKRRYPNQSTHYEFISQSAANSPGFKYFQKESKTTDLVELRVSVGNSDNEETARHISKELGIEFDELVLPRQKTLLAILKIGSMELIRTDSIDDDFARAIQNSMPYALRFEVVRWFKPYENIMGTADRFPYAVTQFGKAPNGLPKYK